MGYYINPKDGSEKEEFLKKHGTPLKADEVNNFDFASDALPVCLVDNGWMTAAGIAYSPQERDVFADPSDHRPKKWYSVPTTLLTEFM